MTESNQIMHTATREAGRQASTTFVTYDDLVTIVSNNLTQAGVTNLTGLQVHVSNLTTGDTGPRNHAASVKDYEPSDASPGDQMEITVSLPYGNVRWGPQLINSGTTRLTSTAVWLCLTDQAYPTTVTVPDGF
jgi:hypothetical protein